MYAAHASGERRAVTYDGPPLNFRFNANQQSGSSYPPSLYAKGFLHHQLHGVASALQNLSTTPVDGVILCPSMLGDR